MLRQINFYTGEDLQMAIENNCPRTNLIKPTCLVPADKSYRDGLIIKVPELGVVYKNHNREKRVALMSEVHKFCDGTLKRILSDVRQQLHNDVLLLVSDSQDPEYRSLLQEANDKIQERLNLRRQLRQYEVTLNMKK